MADESDTLLVTQAEYARHRTTAGYAILTNCDNATALLASLRAMHR